jgi:hypothetical protein
MAVLMTQTMSADVPIEMLDAVTDLMGVDTDPPAGLISHAHYIEAGQPRIVDLWESAADYETFAENRLRPAMAKVASDRGFDIAGGPPPETVITEVQRVIRGR